MGGHVSTYKSLPYKNPGKKQNNTCWIKLSTMNQCVCVCIKSKAVPLHAMEAHGGERRYSSYSFLTSALDGGEWSASHPGRSLPPGERTPGTHWIGGWVFPRAGLDAEARRKILCPCRGSNLDRPARSQTLYWLSYRSFVCVCVCVCITNSNCER
jgi:hypothetical protein